MLAESWLPGIYPCESLAEPHRESATAASAEAGNPPISIREWQAPHGGEGGGGDAQPAHASLEETRISAPRAPTSHVPVSPGPWRGQSVGTEESMEKNSAVYTPPIPFASFLPKTGLEWGAEGVTVWTSSEG